MQHCYREVVVDIHLRSYVLSCPSSGNSCNSAHFISIYNALVGTQLAECVPGNGTNTENSLLAPASAAKKLITSRFTPTITHSHSCSHSRIRRMVQAAHSLQNR